MSWLLLKLKEDFSFKTSLQCLLLTGFLSLLIFPENTSALFEAGSSVSDAQLLSSVQGEGNQKMIWIGLDIHLKPG